MSGKTKEKQLQVPPHKLQTRVKFLEAWRITRTCLSDRFSPGEWAELQLWWDNHKEHRVSRHRIVNGPNYDMKEGEDPVRDGIPGFWLKAMVNHTEIGSMIRRKKFNLFEYLIDVRLEFLDNTDYTLIFVFRENPFFRNEELRKSFYFRPFEGKGIPKAYESRSDFIEWKPGRDVRRLPNLDTTLRNNWPPFFNWISETATSLHPFELQQQFMIGEAFKNDLIPRAIDWYTGALLRTRK